MIRITAFSLVLMAAACGSKSAPASSTPAPTSTEPAGSGAEPAGSDSASPGGDGSATAPPAAASNKCTTSGGHCINMVSTVACKKFEQGPDWGCGGENMGCCFM
jgi:hypothetical protein